MYPQEGCEARSIFKPSKKNFKSEFSFSCNTKIKEPSLIYYLHRAEGKTDRFIPFPKACAQSEKKNNHFHIYIYQPLRSGRIWHKVNF